MTSGDDDHDPSVHVIQHNLASENANVGVLCWLLHTTRDLKNVGGDCVVIVDLGLNLLDDVVDLGFHVDEHKAAAVIVGKVIHNHGRATCVAASDNTPHLDGSLLEMCRGKPRAILDRETSARDVLEAQLVVTQTRCGCAHKEGALLRDGVPPNGDKEGVLERAYFRAEVCVLSGEEVRLVDGDQSQGTTAGAGGKEVRISKERNRRGNVRPDV